MLANRTTERLTLLTPKERACLVLVARRLSSKEIATELGIAKTSVDTYCNRARAKLGVGDRYEAARLLATDMPVGLRSAVAPSSDASAARLSSPLTATPPARLRLLIAIGVLLITVLAVGSLISGLGALEEMKAPPRETARP
jgi:DNA-binding CsgD family transcriptional regulator